MAPVRTLWQLLRPSPYWFSTAILLGVLSSFSEGIGIALFIPILVRFQPAITDSELPSIIQHLLPSSARNNIGLLGFAVLCLICSRSALLYANRMLIAWMDALTGHQLRARIFDSLMKAPISFWDRRDPGKVLDTLSNESWRAAEAFRFLSASVVYACTVVVFTSWLLAISWRLTTLVVGALLVIAIGVRFAMRPVKAVGEEAVLVNAELGDRMWDGVAGIRTIHAFSLEDVKRQRFGVASTQVRRNFLKLEFLSGLISQGSEVLYTALLLAVLLWLLPHQVSATSTLLFAVLLFRLQPNISNLQSCWVNLTGMAGSIQDVARLLDSACEGTMNSAGIPCRPLNRSLRFEGVTFRYDSESSPALDDVTLQIPAGKVTAIVGPSGAGKTTLIHLICRFYETGRGRILVDEQPLKSMDLESWRRRIGLASQDVHLFSATIRENIAFGVDDASDDEVIEAAIQAGAHEFILRLPAGFETRVGERGTRLSGGQRQRIALARAFIRNPDILLLDEATNALDSITEEAVARSLRDMEGKRTIVIVAHRLSTISMADQVIVLDRGRVVQRGHPTELMRSDGPFARLFQAHTSGLVEPSDICGTR